MGALDSHLICPHCGEYLDGSESSCPECGSDNDTGWSDRGNLQRLGVPIPLDEDSYLEIVETPISRKSIASPWLIIGSIAALSAMFFLLLRW